MTITVVSATGSGKTELSAFDCALKNARVYNYNLISLSSVVPTGAAGYMIKSDHTPDQVINKVKEYLAQ